MADLWEQVVAMSNIINQIKNLENKFVTIGVQGEKGEQKKIIRTISAAADLNKAKDNLKSAGVKIVGKLNRYRVSKTLTVAQVAAYNEFGNQKNPKKGPPERSFLRAVLKEKRTEIRNIADKALKKPESFYDIIGTYVLNEIQKKIKSGIAPINALSTIKWKGSSTPLVDFGQLKNALTYKVSNYD
jgi:hypothetical protein